MSPPPPPNERLDLARALWRAAVVMRRMQMRDCNGELMWPRFVGLARAAYQEGA